MAYKDIVDAQKKRDEMEASKLCKKRERATKPTAQAPALKESVQFRKRRKMQTEKLLRLACQRCVLCSGFHEADALEEWVMVDRHYNWLHCIHCVGICYGISHFDKVYCDAKNAHRFRSALS